MERLISGAASLGLELTPGQIEQFQVYYRELVAWNRKVNLTSVVDYEGVQLKHFLDSLSLLTLESDPALRLSFAGARALDVGSGAGFPGLSVKLVRPTMRLTLLESVGKKARFLEHMVAVLGLPDVEVIAARAEEVAHRSGYREAFDIVLSRAVGSLSTLAELCLPFCRPGGVFIAQKGRHIEAEVEAAGRALSTLGGRLHQVKALSLEGLGERKLVVVLKEGSTPPRLPRRPGLPAQRPL